jgi:hypothetical protein
VIDKGWDRLCRRVHPSIRQRTADDGSDDRRNLPVNRGRNASQPLADVVLLLQNRRHPVPHHQMELYMKDLLDTKE